MPGFCSTWITGSSPLTRGKLQALDPDVLREGLIPAHAGKTRSRIYSGRSVWAHPRSRGENGRRAACDHSGSGSSPLTRGKLRDPAKPGSTHGLIPAHAGKTFIKIIKRTLVEAHPRSRGENSQTPETVEEMPGSSPLTRGKPWRAFRRRSDRGLIPAHAGKTSA